MSNLSELREKATKIVNGYALTCAGTAFATGPLPGTSVLLTGVEAKMTYDVAQIYGFKLTIQEAGTTIAALVAASSGLKHIAVEASTAIPVIGWFVVKPTIAAATAKAVGQLAIGHFEDKYLKEK